MRFGGCRSIGAALGSFATVRARITGDQREIRRSSIASGTPDGGLDLDCVLVVYPIQSYIVSHIISQRVGLYCHLRAFRCKRSISSNAVSDKRR